MAKVGRLLKEHMVEELTRQLSERPQVFVARVGRLTALGADELRRKLHASRATFQMVKRRIGLRTFEQLQLNDTAAFLQGSVGLVLTADDPTPIAKELVEFIASHEGQLTLCGARIDGEVLDARRVEVLAKLPLRPVLLAEVVGAIEGPLAAVIGTLERLLGDLAWIIEQIATRKSATTGAQDQQPPPAADAPKAQAASASGGSAVGGSNRRSADPIPHTTQEEAT